MDPFHYQQKRKKWPYVVGLFVVLIAYGAYQAYNWLEQLSVESLLQNNIVQEKIVEIVGNEHKDLIHVLPPFLGFSEPRTYLVLFLNNTEIRPGGGFIGTYAVVRIDKGSMDIIKLDGVENLDREAPESWRPVAPQIITDQLGTDRWYFRDSNWSPDFEISATQALTAYTGEQGVAANEIDAIFGITTTVLEELLALTGPFTVQGLHFDTADVTETLEYEVEFGYRDKGIPFEMRKQIIAPFFQTLTEVVAVDAFEQPKEYFDLFERMRSQKHIMAYGIDPTLQQHIDNVGMTPRLAQTKGDYLMWVDANLAALKTDHAMKRHLTYGSRDIDGTSYRVARMTYTHNGTFDWRTTRYRTFARAYVPAGSQLREVNIVEADGNITKAQSDDITNGEEAGKQWFGVFTVIEPGDTESVEFVYTVSSAIAAADEYSLLIQKQPGTLQPTLTLDIDFGTTIRRAVPAEQEYEWGDARYRLETNLLIDRPFRVTR